MARRASDGGANIQQFVHWYQHAENAARNNHPGFGGHTHTPQQPHIFNQAAPGFGSAPFGGDMMMMPPYAGGVPGGGAMSSSIQSAGTSPDEDDEEDKEAIRRFVSLTPSRNMIFNHVFISYIARCTH